MRFEITGDDLGGFKRGGAAFVTFGEVMVRETPADMERPERTRLVRLSMAGSEFTLAIGLSRLGIPSSYITRVPDNPYGRAVRNIALEQAVDTTHMVWAPGTELMGRLIYEIGRTPRRTVGIYQRKYSAASRLDRGMVAWASALRDARLFHTSGITLGLACHSRYDRNYNLDALEEALSCIPEGCLVGCDFNYRSTLWSPDTAREVMTPVLRNHVDIIITTIEDMARLYHLGCGKYSAQQVVNGDMGTVSDDDIRAFTDRVFSLFDARIVAVTIRYPDSFEHHRWESAAVDADGNFARSGTVRPITLLDRLGGGDTWNAGFYYGLLTENFGPGGLEKGVAVGDAATRLQQTIMYDLPIVGKDEIQALMTADVAGGGKRESR